MGERGAISRSWSRPRRNSSSAIPPEGRLTFVNELYCPYSSGRPREALLSPSWNDYEAVVALEDRARHDELIDSPTPDHPSGTIELQAVMPDGSRQSSNGATSASSTLPVASWGFRPSRDVAERRRGQQCIMSRSGVRHGSD